MKWQPRVIGVVAEVAAFLLAATLTVAPVAAQQVTGELGSPSATTTLEGKQLPPPPPRFEPTCPCKIAADLQRP